MDVDEFERTVPVAVPKSPLAPFKDQLSRLRSAGYTLAQLREFLHRNDVQVSIAAISACLRRMQGAQAKGAVDGADLLPAPLGVPLEPSVQPPAGSGRAGDPTVTRTQPDLDSLIRQGRRMKRS